MVPVVQLKGSFLPAVCVKLRGESYLSVPFRHRYTFQFVSLTPLKAAMRVLLLSFFFAMQLC